jgi:FlaA1/EpsC-like NDP-sugar epimerase
MAGSQSKFIVRNRHFLLFDLAIFVFSAAASYFIRLETPELRQLIWGGLLLLVAAVPVRLYVFLVLGMYKSYWRNAGPSELLLIAAACGISGAVITTIIFAISLLWPQSQAILPRSIPIIDALVTGLLVAASRFSLRAYQHMRVRRNRNGGNGGKRALIVGAGQMGIRVLEALDLEKKPIATVGFLDDDLHKSGQNIRGLPVLGRIADLLSIVSDDEVDLVVVAIAHAPRKLLRQIAEDCRKAGIEHRTMPGVGELLTGEISISTLRPISIDDLLGRSPVQFNLAEIEQSLKGRCIMITGAGGSIGSELARQISRFRPDRLVLVGHGETSLFATESKLKNEFPHVAYEVMLADIRDRRRMEGIFQRTQPEFVFHAAAHKHVPMLENNALEAVTNNVVGTCNVIHLCKRFNTQRMVMISTDKAVKPISIMGMTKRVAELVVMNAALECPGRFAAVRFGNVLGSRGSVVPIFQQQIAAGGPVTVTSEKMTRFFMSIPEAVLLVLKASVLIECGPLFVLNMGDPVCILDLAHDLIRLSGAEPERDIEIKITGVRPGEKLHEELFWDDEAHDLIEDGAIYTLRLTPEQANVLADQMPARISALIQAAERHDEKSTRDLLAEIVFSRVHDGAVARSVEIGRSQQSLSGAA